MVGKFAFFVFLISPLDQKMLGDVMMMVIKSVCHLTLYTAR